MLKGMVRDDSDTEEEKSASEDENIQEFQDDQGKEHQLMETSDNNECIQHQETASINCTINVFDT